MENQIDIFKPIKKIRAFEEIADRIKKLIIQRVLKPGDKLPPESELGRRYNVGRQTIREAMRLLEVSGFVSTVKGGSGGVYIQDGTIHRLAESFMNVIKMIEVVSIEEVMEVRLEIEKLAFRDAIKHADEENINELKEIIDSGKKDTELGNHSGYDNILFHKKLARISRNRLLIIFVDLIMALIDNVIDNIPSKYSRGKVQSKQHKKILKALIERDEDSGLRLLEEHIFTVSYMITNAYESENERYPQF